MELLSRIRKSMFANVATVEQIHEEFDSAQERLLAEAKQIIAHCKKNNEKETETYLADRAERLNRLGFISAKEVIQIEEVKKEKEKNKKVLVKNLEQAELIERYKETYPFQKFLTESELHRICEKYNLIYAPVKSYIKDVPDKNLKEIENAKPLMLGDGYINTVKVTYKLYNYTHDDSQSKYINPKEAESLGWDKVIELNGNWADRSHVKTYLEEKYNPKKQISVNSVEYTVVNKDGLFIAAPKSHFKLGDLKQDNKNKYGFFNITVIEQKDPIVFRYCRGGIQILSKWGLEAKDEILINPIEN